MKCIVARDPKKVRNKHTVWTLNSNVKCAVYDYLLCVLIWKIYYYWKKKFHHSLMCVSPILVFGSEQTLNIDCYFIFRRCCCCARCCHRCRCSLFVVDFKATHWIWQFFRYMQLTLTCISQTKTKKSLTLYKLVFGENLIYDFPIAVDHTQTQTLPCKYANITSEQNIKRISLWKWLVISWYSEIFIIYPDPNRMAHKQNWQS